MAYPLCPIRPLSGKFNGDLVFNIEAELSVAEQQGDDKRMRQLIQQQLLKAGIRLKDSRHHVRFDSEESCLREDNGNWQKRLTRLVG